MRQKVPHRRTFLYLEQLILTHKADKEALNIKEVKDGMDFFFASKQAGAKFNGFLASVVPTVTKESGRVIGISHHVRSARVPSNLSIRNSPQPSDGTIPNASTHSGCRLVPLRRHFQLHSRQSAKMTWSICQRRCGDRWVELARLFSAFELRQLCRSSA